MVKKNIKLHFVTNEKSLKLKLNGKTVNEYIEKYKKPQSTIKTKENLKEVTFFDLPQSY